MKVPTQPITPVNDKIASAIRDLKSELEQIKITLGYLNGNVAQILNKMGRS